MKYLNTKYGLTNNKDMKQEVWFNDCRNNLPLPFDLVLYDNFGKVSAIIEYDGEQHFKPIFPLNKSIEEKELKLKMQKENDSIKNNFCKTNNIPLLRLNYQNINNMNNIIDKFLSSTTILKGSTFK